MSPDERAKDVVSDFDFNPVVTHLLSEAIATAIREAEDAAYERAAGAISDRWGDVTGIILKSVRSLKSQEEKTP